MSFVSIRFGFDEAQVDCCMICHVLAKADEITLKTCTTFWFDPNRHGTFSRADDLPFRCAISFRRLMAT